MTQEDAKDVAVAALSGQIDQVINAVLDELRQHSLSAKLLRVDYVAQTVILEFDKIQPTSDLVDEIGRTLRRKWLAMPDITATLFKMSKLNTKLILDLNSPSGIEALANEGDVAALAAVASGTDYLPAIHYNFDDKQKLTRNESIAQVHERRI